MNQDTLRRVARAFVVRKEEIRTYYPINVSYITPFLPFVLANLVQGYTLDTNCAWECIWNVFVFLNIWDKYEEWELYEADDVIQMHVTRLPQSDMHDQVPLIDHHRTHLLPSRPSKRVKRTGSAK